MPKASQQAHGAGWGLGPQRALLRLVHFLRSQGSAETGPLPSRGSKLDPGLGEAGKRFPAGLQVTPARDGGPAGLLPCHELPPTATFRDGATAGLSPHRTVTHFSRAIPIPEMHRERNSGKGSSSLESLARSKATLGRNPIVCLFTDESESPKPKGVPAWHMVGA